MQRSRQLSEAQSPSSSLLPERIVCTCGPLHTPCVTGASCSTSLPPSLTPFIYSRKVQGHAELADSQTYQEARRRGKKVMRDIYKPPEGGDKCESGVARRMVHGCKAEEEAESDLEMDIERQEGKR
eukprot:6198782-Pleurochrysis_carterae.AAC.1